MAAAKGNRYAAKYDNGKMEVLIESLLDHCANAKSIHLASWCRSKGISKSWLSETAQHYPQLKEAMIVANELLSEKIVNTSFYGKGNATVGMQYIGVYDTDFRKYQEWKEDIKHKELSEDEIRTVVKVIDYSTHNKEKKEAK